MMHWFKTLSRLTIDLPDPVQRIGLGMLFGLTVTGFVLLGTDTLLQGFFDLLEQTTLDFRHAIKIRYVGSQKKLIEDVVIVDMDAFSRYKMGRYNRWKRAYHAAVVDSLKRGGARVIGLDILFDPDREPSQDEQRLAEAVARAGNVYTALALLPADSSNYLYAMDHNPYAAQHPSSTLPLPKPIQNTFFTAERIEGPFAALAQVAEGLVLVNTWPDQDGIHRSVPLVMNFAGVTYPAMSLRVAMDWLEVSPSEVTVVPNRFLKLGQKGVIPIDGQGRMLLRYYGGGGPEETFRYISYYDVYAGRIQTDFFSGKIVLVGSSMPGLGDLLSVPFGYGFPGVELHATAIWNIINSDFLRRMETATTRWIVLVLAALVAILSMLVRPLKGALLTLGLMLAYAVGGVLMFVRYDFWIELVRPENAILLAYMMPLMYRHFTEERARRRIKQAFQHYLSPLVVEEVIRDPDKLKLGGEKRELTVLFSDLVGFTRISEKLSPEALHLLLNEYLTAMSDIILKHDGLIDKYEGDAIMALFGAPAWRPDHALQACHAALEMQKKLTQLRSQWEKEGKPALYLRIGINTGEMVVGNMGTNTRMDYTAIGDNVNLASRLEGANKQYGTGIMISEMTYAQTQGQIVVRELDVIRAKGKQESTTVYEVLGPSWEILSPVRVHLLNHYDRGLAAYRARHWEEAEAAFAASLELDENDGPAQVYQRRCAVYRRQPPQVEWDGVFQLETK